MGVLDIGRSSFGIARMTHSHLTLLSTPRRRIPWSEGFYEVPDGLEKFAPGELIRYEPMHAYLVPGVRLRARAWRILYRSTGAVGEPTAVSGTLLLPENARWSPTRSERTGSATTRRRRGCSPLGATGRQG
jgi:hypothetical protein